MAWLKFSKKSTRLKKREDVNHDNAAVGSRKTLFL